MINPLIERVKLKTIALQGDISAEQQRIISNKSKEYRELLAANVNLSTELFYELSEVKDANVHTALAGNPNLPSGLIARFAASVIEDVRIALAENVVTPRSVLNELAKDFSWDVRHSVALNPNYSSVI